MTGKKIIWILIPIIIMSTIIFLSNDSGLESNKKSDILLNFMKPLVESIQNIIKEKFGYTVSERIIVRKSAHFINYFFLETALLLLIIKIFSKINIYSALGSIVFIFGFASFDEYFQKHVSGRTGKLSDVFIDVAGAIFALVIYAIIKLVKNIREKLEK